MMKKQDVIEKIISFGASTDTAEKVYDFFTDPLDSYLLERFEPTEKDKKKWIPAYEILGFLKKEEPLIFEDVTVNSLGRAFTRLGIESGYRNYPKKQKTYGGYYVNVVSNIFYFRLNKYLKNE